MLSSSRICECNSGLCVKNSLCNYDTKTNSYQSSSGIDINEYERDEHFGNVNNSKYFYRNRNPNRNRRNNFPIIIILIISILLFVFFKKN